MAKMSFSTTNKAADAENFPKFRLEQDESARIVCFEEPEVGFVHNLRAPKMVNGAVQYKSVRNKDGSTREEMEYDFIGNPICLGDFNVLSDRGIDPKNCPACKAAQEAPDMFAPPKRRFAMHIFQYTTNGTSKAPTNFQGSVKVWAFTDQRFAELIDIADEADGGLPNIDILVGPCESKMFQKAKVLPSQKSVKNASEANKAQFEAIVAENKAKDLSKFLGRSTRKEWLEDDLDKVRTRWKQVNGQQGEKADDGLANAERNLDAGLAVLLDSAPEIPKTANVSQGMPSESKKNDEGPVDFDDLLAGLEED